MSAHRKSSPVSPNSTTPTRRNSASPSSWPSKGSNRHQILAAFEERIHNSPEQEFARALAEINKIALFRLQAM